MSRESRTVLRTEIKCLLRDRKAFFLAVVLPMLLYPALFAGMEKLDIAAERSVEEKIVRVGHDLEALPISLRLRLLSEWSAPNLNLELFPSPAADVELFHSLGDDEAREKWTRYSANFLLSARTLEGGETFVLDAVMNGSDTLSRAASERIGKITRRIDSELAKERLVAVAGFDPAAPFDVEPRDVARPENASGLALGKLLPLLAVLMLISGGSFAALGAFAGEREAGTMETLFVQPIRAEAIAKGKFAAVLLTAVAALIGNALSFLTCLALGIGQASFLPGFSLGATGGRLFLGLILFAPTAFLLSALLCWISARARSFREGQHYILPLVLFSIAPAGLATVERVELNWLFALLPIAGSALALRDAMSGSLLIGPALLAFFAGSFWAWLALSRVSRTLDAERLFSTPATHAERRARQAAGRTAFVVGIVAVLLVYSLGGRLQAWRLVPGLTLTLAVLLPALTWIAVRRLRHLTDASAFRILSLRAPAPLHLAGALLAAPLLAMASAAIFKLQSGVLPVPEAFALFELDFSPTTTLLLLCLAPAFFEELLFRGALLFGFRHDWSLARTLLWQAILFGAVHASIYRFFPTAFAGAALAAVALRTRSLWPAVLLHAGHNAWIAFGAEHGLPTWSLVLAGLLGIGFLATRGRAST